MRVCLAYDCLYPWTIGGAERWYRQLASALVQRGHEVTYLTRRQWDEGEHPDVPGVRVIVVSRRDSLYDAEGRRLIAPTLRFGAGVLRHLATHRTAYDDVHLCSFPYFSLLGARLALAGTGTPLGVDWFEVWSRNYWRGYVGRLRGTIGWLVQRLCVRAPQQAYVYSDLHARRLVEEGIKHPPLRLPGLAHGGHLPEAIEKQQAEPLVVFAGRHIPEKRPELVPPAVATARAHIPNLRGLVLGDGPRRDAVLAAIRSSEAEGFVEAPGFVGSDEVAGALAKASCHLLPSSREGYGLVIIEASAYGTPSVVVAGEDNAAAELIQEGVNGFVAATVDDLPEAVAAVHAGGEALRASTQAWFADRAEELSGAHSINIIAERIELGNSSQR